MERESLKGPKVQKKKVVLSTSTPEVIATKPQEEKKKTNKGLIGIVIFLAFLFILITGYIIYKEFNQIIEL